VIPSTRREFFGRLGAAAVAARTSVFGMAQRADAASSASVAAARRSGAAAYDLLIAGGRVVDPALRLFSVADVAISNGVIARVAPSIPRSEASEVFEARGRIVTPGLIDTHGHVFDGVASSNIDPDLVGLPRGVTTIVDAGSAGAQTFPGFRKHVIERARTRVYALLNISRIGLTGPNETYVVPSWINGPDAIRTIEANRDRIVGLKVRINGRHEDLARDLEILKVGREVSDATGVPIHLHWTNETSLLELLKAGDTLVHPFNPDSPNQSNLVGGTGAEILPQILELRSRGIWTDFAHGNHLDWSVAETAAKAGWYPDAISTDIHRGHVAPNGVVHDLTTTMSKFVYLGLTVDQAIERVTTNPTRMLKFPERLGTLADGAVADVSVLEVVDGQFQLIDTRRQARTGRQMIRPVAAFQAGKAVAIAEVPPGGVPS
jgi:dihydroorotase